jgi:D-sedoheptulose 7-phosphate isomerase
MLVPTLETLTRTRQPQTADGDQLVAAYLGEVARITQELPTTQIRELVEVLDRTRLAGRKVLLCGNGGSGATASHWANDLNKGASGPCRPRMRAMAITDSMPLLTALANDLAYTEVFAEQVQSWGEPDDVLICISGSGNSPNVIQATHAARQRGMGTVGILGFGGGQMAGLVDLALIVDSHCMEQVEDAHMIVTHAVTTALRNCAQEPRIWPEMGV